MQPNYVNINGQLRESALAQVSHDNRAFRYGYGLFETMLVQAETIALATSHWKRLLAGMKQLYFTIPKHFTGAFLQEEVLRTARKNKLEKLCRVRLQVYAGSGGYFDHTGMLPEFLIECFPLNAQVLLLNENGLDVGIATGLQKSADTLAALKSSNALIYALAAQQAKEHKWNDALICNTQGNIIESTIANIFWVKDRQLFTPPVSEGCVAGVMRRFIIDKLAVSDTPVTEKILSVSDLHNADEIFLTNAIRRIKWVKSASDKHFTNGITKDAWHFLFEKP